MTNKSNLDALIYKDSREEIRRYECDGVKFNVLSAKAGVFGNGDYHPVAQYNLILKGRFEITLRQEDREIITREGSNDLIVIPPNIPHLFKSLTDTVMIEWWDGPFEAKDYEPYRKLIEKQRKK